MMAVQNNHRRNDLCVEIVRDLAGLYGGSVELADSPLGGAHIFLITQVSYEGSE